MIPGIGTNGVFVFLGIASCVLLRFIGIETGMAFGTGTECLRCGCQLQYPASA